MTISFLGSAGDLGEGDYLVPPTIVYVSGWFHSPQDSKGSRASIVR